MSTRLPAEWELQDALLTTWPHNADIWGHGPEHDAACEVFVQIVRHTSCSGQRVLLVVPPADADAIGERLAAAGSDMDLVTLLPMASNDCWTRDFGPITVYHNGAPVILDFTFNGWGLKYPANHDNQFSRRWHATGATQARLETIALVLEGGSLDSDGEGRILTTSTCLLEANRNPTLPKEEIDWRLKHLLGATEIIWIENGLLLGDDTDSHVDNLARFAPGNTILYASCDDPTDPHHAPLLALGEELAATGARLIPLPIPAAVFSSDDRRLPGSHLNYIILNHAVLVPTFDDPADAIALARIAEAYPGRQVIGIDTRPILQQNGSLHCVTMHLPKGVLQ